MKLKYKYNNTELLVAIEKTIKLIQVLIVNKEYDIEYLSSRLDVQNQEMMKDVLRWMSEAGFITIGKNGEYYIIDN